MERRDFTFDGAGGATIEATCWLPAAAPRGIVQIAHGASEHLDRYERVAAALVTEGLGVYADDHRGHGRTADRHGRFGIARPGGWSAMVEDEHRLTEAIRDTHPGVPVVLFGHSMGSFIAQGYVQRWGGDLAGLVLSGSSRGLEGADELLPVLEGLAATAPDDPSELFTAMFAGFNEPFAGESPTGFEWLSRDDAEVQKYVADPWCGFPLSNGFVADMIAGMTATWDPAAEERVPGALPTLIVSGAQDPVGGFGESVRALADRYAELGVGPLTTHLYPDGRHEMVNETNRDAVVADLIGWLDGALAG